MNLVSEGGIFGQLHFFSRCELAFGFFVIDIDLDVVLHGHVARRPLHHPLLLDELGLDVQIVAPGAFVRGPIDRCQSD